MIQLIASLFLISTETLLRIFESLPFLKVLYFDYYEAIKSLCVLSVSLSCLCVISDTLKLTDESHREGVKTHSSRVVGAKITSKLILIGVGKSWLRDHLQPSENLNLVCRKSPVSNEPLAYQKLLEPVLA